MREKFTEPVNPEGHIETEQEYERDVTLTKNFLREYGHISPDRDREYKNGTTITDDSSEFLMEWEKAGKPKTYGVISQKDDTFSLSYTDTHHNLHTLKVRVNENSWDGDSQAVDVHHFYTGDYRLSHLQDAFTPYGGLGDSAAKDPPPGDHVTPEGWIAKGGHVSDFANTDDAHKFGWAANSLILVNSPVSGQHPHIPHDGYMEPTIDPITRELNGGHRPVYTIYMHGAGSQLLEGSNDDRVMQPYQPLVAASGCVRMHNIDAYNLAVMSQHAEIPVRLSHSPTIMHSVDGKEWKPMDLGETHTGPLTFDVDANDKHIVTQQLANSSHKIKYQLSDLEAIGFKPHEYRENVPVTIATSLSSEQSLTVGHDRHNTKIADLHAQKPNANANQPAHHAHNVEASTQNVPYPAPRAGTAPPQLVSHQAEGHVPAHNPRHGTRPHAFSAKAQGHSQGEHAQRRSPWVDRVLAKTSKAIEEGAQQADVSATCRGICHCRSPYCANWSYPA